MSTEHITADEAIAAVKAQAFTITDPDASDCGRTIVHSVAIGGPLMLGADWDLDDVVTELWSAREIAWFDDFMGHELALISAEGRAYKFEVKRPAEVTE
jgi:hypothetical protein